MTRRLSLLSLALLALAGTACGRYLTTGIATVNGTSIDREDLDRQVAGSQPPDGSGSDDPEQRLQNERQAIVELILNELVRQEAKRFRVSVSEAQIETRVQALAEAQPDQVQAVIEARGPEAMDEIAEGQLLAEGVAERAIGNVEATEEEIRAAYGDGRRFEEILLRHILFQVQPGADEAAAKKKAQSALDKLKAGADFATLAKQVSEDPGSKDNGGSYGYVTREVNFDETFLNAAFAVKEGKISGLVRTQFGFHIIKVDDRRSKTLDQARAELAEQISDTKRNQAFQEFFVERLRAADIVVNPRWGDFNPETFQIEDHQFFVPPSPEPQTEPIPFG